MNSDRFSLARFVMGWWLAITERKQRLALRNALDTIAAEAIKSRSRDFPASATILNISLYFLIAERDIQSLKISALTHADNWTRKLYLRVLLLTIYEIDLDEVAGATLKRAFEVGKVSKELQTQTHDVLRQVRAVQKKATQKFRFLRNNTIGHRNKDAVAQYLAITELTTDDVFDVAKDFYTAIRPLIDLLPKLLAETGKMESLIRQWAVVQSSKAPSE
jgi:hypothetical protein